MPSDNNHLRDLGTRAWDQLDQALQAFENAWQSGKRPKLEDYLPAGAEERAAALVELVLLDLEYRLKAREPARAEEYLRRFAELRKNKGKVLEVLEREYRVRSRFEPGLEVKEYARRFPQLREELSARLYATETIVGTPAPLSSGREQVGTICGVQALIERLTEVPILSATQRLELQPGGWVDRCPDAATLVRELIQRDLLTSFQAELLFQDRGHELVLGPYLLLDRLGEGGMGTVYKARHQVMKRVVAVKVIRKGMLSYGEQVQRFQREIEAASQLSHANIVHAYDAGLVGDQHYFAMELVEGTDLARWLKEKGALPVELACDCIRQAALGLQHAHERGLVHRDIKPSNLIVIADGSVTAVKILDMGLARLHFDPENRGRLTRLGEVMGTPDYIAPEQSLDASRVDIRADIYSLGCTLYHLLAGQAPFPGGSLVDKLVKHRSSERPSIPSGRGIPPELQEILLRMMARNPDDRFQSPKEVAEVLTPFCDARNEAAIRNGLPPTQPMPDVPLPETMSTIGVIPQPSARGPWQKRAIQLMGAAAILSLALLTWRFWPHSSESPKLGEYFTNTIGMTLKLIPAGTFLMGSQDGENERQLDEGPQHNVTISKSFYLGIHEVTVGQFRAFVEATGYRTAGEKSGILDWDSNAKGWNLKKLSWRDPGWPQTDVHPVVGVNWEDSVRFCQWLSDAEGKRYRLPTEAEWEYACRAGTTTAYSFGDSADRLEQFAWIDKNAEGKTQRVGRLAPNPWGLFDMHGNVAEWCIDNFDADFYKKSPRVNPIKKTRVGFDDGHTSARGGWIYAGKARARSAHRTYAPALSSGSTAGGFRVLCELPAEETPFDSQFLDAMSATQIPEKSKLDGIQNLVGVLENNPTATASFHAVSFSPDGRYLQSKGGIQVLWDLQTQAWVSEHSCNGGSTAAFSPDGRSIVVNNKDCELWDVLMNVPVRRLEECPKDYINSQSFSPDGKQVLMGHRDGRMRIWDVATGKLLRKITVYDGDVREARFSADGRRVVTSPIPSGKSAGQVFLWDAETWNKVDAFAINGQMGSRVEFAPKGHSFTFGNGDGTVHYWKMDGDTRQLVELKSGHAKEVVAVAFTPDGKRLVTVSLDGKIVLWDLATQAATVLGQAPGAVLDVKLSPDGRYLAFPCEKTPGKIYIAKMPAG